MSCSRRAARLILFLLAGIPVVLETSSCNRSGYSTEERQVKQAFESCKTAIMNRRADVIMTYLASDVGDYFKILNSGAHPPQSLALPNSPSSESPGVNLLLRTALDRKVPVDLRPHLTLNTLLQRIEDKHLLNPREVKQIHLGRVSVNGDRASAELYYEDTLTALRLPFVKQGGVWRIDVLAILPYAEILMRVDRAIKSETQSEQVDQLIGRLPSL